MKSDLEKSGVSTEDRFFNITGTISKSLPDAIYKCYNIPSASLDAWTVHY